MTILPYCVLSPAYTAHYIADLCGDLAQDSWGIRVGNGPRLELLAVFGTPTQLKANLATASAIPSMAWLSVKGFAPISEGVFLWLRSRSQLQRASRDRSSKRIAHIAANDVGYSAHYISKVTVMIGQWERVVQYESLLPFSGLTFLFESLLHEPKETVTLNGIG